MPRSNPVAAVTLAGVPALVITADDPRAPTIARLLGALRRQDDYLARTFADALLYRDPAMRAEARQEVPDLFALADAMDAHWKKPREAAR